MPGADNKKLIEKFFSNNCDYMEAEAIAERLEKDLDLLDSIPLAEDLAPSEIIRTPYSQKEVLLNAILNKGKAKVLLLKRVAVAASVIGLLLLGWWLFSKNSYKPAPPVEVIIAENNIRNNTNELMNYTLPDSSEIVLAPNAEVKFKADFKSNRNVSLTGGDVYFKVRKNADYPFSVTANGISTAALGTKFWVRNFAGINSLSISLTEGLVLIRSVDSAFSMEPVHLKPGQICSIDKLTGKVDVSGGNKNTKVKIPGTVLLKADEKNDASANKIHWTNDGIQFSNASLENVFAKLENQYGVKITTEGINVKSSYLTGKIFYSDSLEVVIRSICELNSLKYEKRNDTIILSKN